MESLSVCLKVSGEFFQKRLIQVIDDLSGVTCVLDDILIFGATQNEHDKTMHNFFNASRREYRFCYATPLHLYHKIVSCVNVLYGWSFL